MPRVSVILPTRNRAALLGRAIHSVLAQSWTDLELVVVDDASTDETPAVARAFADPRLQYVRQPDNRRVAAARNAGIARASGELIAFQDDDDQWLVHKLAAQVAALDAVPDAGLCLAGHIRVYAGRAAYIGGPASMAALDYRAGMSSAFHLIATPGWLVRRSALDRAGLFDERLDTWEDWELGLRLSQVCRFIHVDEPLYIQDRIRGGALWRDEAAYAGAMTVIMEKHGALWAQRRDVTARHHLIIGRGLCRFHDVRAGRRWLMRAIRTRPGWLKPWAFLLVSLFGTGAVTAATRFSRALALAVQSVVRHSSR